MSEGKWWYSSIVLDTREKEVRFPSIEDKEFKPQTLYHEYEEYGTIKTDFIVRQDSLILFPEEYSLTLVGTLEKPVPLYDFLFNFTEVAPPFGLKISTFAKGDDIIGAIGKTDRGYELFLSREGL
jgi:hypothetical protein